ncbi:uncharacterized protein EI90DRAFT_2670712 [Cantharellus anzutake]|uniref:uncharacterized protein n=1 Tax=Cantharellus anzutake TaxID=1750568 RepID=UPI001908ADC7|nr:uncharacterized protein EI90DRAFT_2670712 [Cantharellus anzutake]KAF8337607.1 hypothetical protein EI90DRAFT_2670712 [Cantharellus anzutake]
MARLYSFWLCGSVTRGTSSLHSLTHAWLSEDDFFNLSHGIGFWGRIRWQNWLKQAQNFGLILARFRVSICRLFYYYKSWPPA